jgi:hypothetical protein
MRTTLKYVLGASLSVWFVLVSLVGLASECPISTVEGVVLASSGEGNVYVKNCATISSVSWGENTAI